MELLKGADSRLGSGNYWHQLRADLLRKRNRMAAILMKANMRPIIPQGGYFMLTDFSPFAKKFQQEYLAEQEGGALLASTTKNATRGGGGGGEVNGAGGSASFELAEKPNTNDYKFVRWLSKFKKLQGIPGSAFYSRANKHLAENLVRFCFIKEESTLDKLELLIENLTTAKV